ncbi:translation initiation factor IF-2 isoform X3 [Camelus ferus]|uniref:Translation initiation factor IF-2 isoform X3 n=1 Tax=Camelus ferus TaxID=419612 RepID=A0A8B8SZ73_CAMFR|nr:translation initiation factor IF-2 isoform X3 [Camelus ferus]
MCPRPERAAPPTCHESQSARTAQPRPCALLCRAPPSAHPMVTSSGAQAAVGRAGGGSAGLPGGAGPAPTRQRRQPGPSARRGVGRAAAAELRVRHGGGGRGPRGGPRAGARHGPRSSNLLPRRAVENMRVLVAPHPCQHLVFSVLQMSGHFDSGERTGQKRPSVQSTEQRGRWLDPAPGWCSSAACVCSPGWHEAPGTSPALRLGGQETRGK